MYAGTAALIDAVLADGLDQPESETYDSTVWRPRCLRRLNAAFLTLLGRDHWDWAYDSTTVSFTDGDGTAPTAFKIIGPQGGLFIQGQKKQLAWRPLSFIRQQREILAATSGDPLYYTYANGSILLDKLVSGDMNLYYLRRRVVLTDADPGGLDMVPEDLRDCLFWGTLAELAPLLGDGRAGDFEAKFEKAINDAIRLRQQDAAGQLEQLGDNGISELGQW